MIARKAQPAMKTVSASSHAVPIKALRRAAFNVRMIAR